MPTQISRHIHLVLSCVLLINGLGARAQVSSWRERPVTGDPTQASFMSEVRESGFLHGSIQGGNAVVTMYDTSGDIQWSEKITIPGVPPLRGIQSLELIDDGPSYFILANSVENYPFTITDRFYLIEFNDLHQPVFAVSLTDTSSSCGDHFIETSRIGHAHRNGQQGYLINEPGDNGVNCVCKVDGSGIPIWWRLYSAGPLNTPDNWDFGGFYGSRTSDGGMLLPNTAIGGFHIHRLDSMGNIVWAKKYVTGNPYDQAWRIVELIDGNLIVTGLHGEAVSNGAHWLMLLKLSPSGDIIWHRRISKQGPINYPGFPYGLRIGPNGDILIRTHIYGQGDNLIRCDSIGFIQEMVYMEQQQGFQEGLFLDMLPSFDLVLSGSTESDLGASVDESPFFSISADLVSIQCNVENVDWINEPYPTEVTVFETGAVQPHIHWIWRYEEVEVAPMEWTREDLCTLFTTNDHTSLSEDIRVFPTIASNRDIITLEHPIPILHIGLFNMNGAPFPISPSNGLGRTHVGLSTIPPGVYFLKAVLQDGIPRTFKVLVMG